MVLAWRLHSTGVTVRRYPTIELPELTQDRGNRRLEGTNKTRTQEKGAVTPQETDPDLSVSVHESPVEAWVSGGLLQDWGP